MLESELKSSWVGSFLQKKVSSNALNDLLFGIFLVLSDLNASAELFMRLSELLVGK